MTNTTTLSPEAKRYIEYYPKEIELMAKIKQKETTVMGRGETWHFISTYPTEVAGIFNQCLKDHIKIREGEPIIFLDVGCGVGNIMNIFKTVNYLLDKNRSSITKGIEHNLQLTRLAEQAGSGNVWQGDARQYSHYDEPDIIFYYQPIRDEAKMKRLEKKIENNCKVGTIIIAHLKIDRSIRIDKRFRALDIPHCNYEGQSGFHVYQKIKA